jgi:hypothetical protein
MSLKSGGLHEKHAVATWNLGIWKPSQHLLADRGKPRMFKNSDHTSKKTQHFIITNIILLTLFKELIPVYTEDHTQPIG